MQSRKSWQSYRQKRSTNFVRSRRISVISTRNSRRSGWTERGADNPRSFKFQISTTTFWDLLIEDCLALGFWDLGFVSTDRCKRELVDTPRLVELHVRCFETCAALRLRALPIQ